MRADPDLVSGLIEALRPLGRTESGGVTRLGLSDLEREAMEIVRGRLDELGLETRYDAGGNLRAVWAAGEGAPVMTGSHLDSVVEGGHYDGPAGVVTAVAAISAMKDAGVEPGRPVEIIVFTSEEGSRFGAGLLGSTALARGLTEEQLARAGPDGVSLAEALTGLGGDPEAAREPLLRPGDAACFVEVHIEQGTVLEEAGAAIGVVTGIAAPVFLRVEVRGVADHAGATPMDARHDALLGAAEVALAAERIAAGSDGVVATVGQMQAFPGSTNIIPGRAVFTLDIRDLDVEARDRVEREILDHLDAVCARRELTYEIETLHRENPVPCDPEVRDALASAVRQVTGGDPVRLPSRAAHDTMVMADICPIGMLFVRCREGFSHTPDEYASTEDLTTAADALALALTDLAG